MISGFGYDFSLDNFAAVARLFGFVLKTCHRYDFASSDLDDDPLAWA